VYHQAIRDRGLGLFAAERIPKYTFLGITHVKREDASNEPYFRTPLGGFYNHSDVSNAKSIFARNLDEVADLIPGTTYDLETVNQWINRSEIYEKEGQINYRFMVTLMDINMGEEIKLTYNLYTP
jgi:SET domain-containing protein